MSAAQPFVLHEPVIVTLPRELEAVLDEDTRLRFAFARLGERDRSNYVAYVADATIPEVRERRAALVAISLATLAHAYARS